MPLRPLSLSCKRKIVVSPFYMKLQSIQNVSHAHWQNWQISEASKNFLLKLSLSPSDIYQHTKSDNKIKRSKIVIKAYWRCSRTRATIFMFFGLFATWVMVGTCFLQCNDVLFKKANALRFKCDGFPSRIPL